MFQALKAILNFPKQKKIIKVKDISPQKERKILSDQESDVLMSADEMEVDDEKNAITDKTALYKAMFPDYTWLLIALTQLQFFDALLISVVYAIRQVSTLKSTLVCQINEKYGIYKECF